MEYQLGSNTSQSNKGKITCNRSILLSIINLATKEIDGVSSLCDNFGGVLKKWFSDKYYEGVKIDVTEKGILVDVYIIIKFGYTVSDVAYRVQENIKNGISSMMDIQIKQINVHILGVDFPKEN